MATVGVYLEACKVGHLEKGDFKHVFGYDSNAVEALSLSMPLRTESYSSQPLLQQLSCQHKEFTAIAEHISELIKQPF